MVQPGILVDVLSAPAANLPQISYCSVGESARSDVRGGMVSPCCWGRVSRSTLSELNLRICYPRHQEAGLFSDIRRLGVGRGRPTIKPRENHPPTDERRSSCFHHMLQVKKWSENKLVTSSIRLESIYVHKYFPLRSSKARHCPMEGTYHGEFLRSVILGINLGRSYRLRLTDSGSLKRL